MASEKTKPFRNVLNVNNESDNEYDIELIDSEENFDVNKVIDDIKNSTKDVAHVSITTNNDNIINDHKYIINDKTTEKHDIELNNRTTDDLKHIINDKELMITELIKKINILSMQISELNNTKKMLNNVYEQIVDSIVHKKNEINKIKSLRNDDVKESQIMKLLSVNRDMKNEQEIGTSNNDNIIPKIKEIQEVIKPEITNKKLPQNSSNQKQSMENKTKQTNTNKTQNTNTIKSKQSEQESGKQPNKISVLGLRMIANKNGH